MKSEPGSYRFFLTPPHDCSYLPDRQAQTLFLDPREPVQTGTYSHLTEQGFRRSGAHLYRPHCKGCQACVPTRVPVARFQPNRTQRRTRRRNEDLRYTLTSAQFEPEVYALYERYIAERHRDGDMYPASADQFRTFLLSQWSETYFLRAYQDNRLLAVAVIDRLRDGLSAIYTFFDPDEGHRSLGVQMVLRQIQLCQDTELPYLYLGYWIEDSAKMRYKTNFRPVELFFNRSWMEAPL